jgi:hypothetical protein
LSPLFRRRILALSIPLVTWACVSLPPEPEFYPPPANCPPGDRTDWYLDAEAPKAKSIRWVQVSAADRDSACQAAMWEDGAALCAYTWGASGVVYATLPRWHYPTWLREHEECHTQGWRHDQRLARRAKKDPG